MRAVNPSVVHCTIRGYPSDGPDAERPGYDFLMQGLGGIMSMQGEPDGEPIKVAVAISDIVAGLFAELRRAGRAARARAQPGAAASCEVSLLDAQVAWLANRAGDWLIAGIEPQRLGNAHPSIVPYETFHAEDGYVNLAIGTDDHFRRFCREAGRGDLADDPRYAHQRRRVEGRGVAGAAAAGTDRRSRRWREWIEVLERAHVPGGPVLSIPETFAGPAAHMVETGRSTQPPGEIGLVRSPMRPDGRTARQPAAARRGWASTPREVLEELGYGQSEIAELLAGPCAPR